MSLETKNEGTRATLDVRLLGELTLIPGHGRPLNLPASKKTRALLGYLIATGEAHRREKLCDFFWDGPDDPRAELRWSLSKIRSVLETGTAKLVADRQRVSIALEDTSVDLLSLRSISNAGLDETSTEALKNAAELCRGEFLDGLDLPLCYRYQEWCMAEREAASQQRLAIFAELIERLSDQPAEALPYARALAVSDPLSEPAHAAVVRLLSRMGKNKQAREQYEHARRVLEAELGARPTGVLEEAHKTLKSSGEARENIALAAAQEDAAPQRAPAERSSSSMVGRDTERVIIDTILENTCNGRSSNIVLVRGEPGIGKSCLLKHIGERVSAIGGSAFGARAFEPEVIRPYGIWFDLLAIMSRAGARDASASPRGGFLLDAEAPGRAADRTQMFNTVLDFLKHAASKRPTAILLDDIQWMDEASSSLLHYVARELDPASGLLIVCAARSGEIDDNTAVVSVLRSLIREKRLREIALGPLRAEDMVQLISRVDPVLDAARIFSESEGNPLFALELAQAHRRGDSDPGPTIESVIVGQLSRLTEPARDTLLWAAANARAFTPDDLARAAQLDLAELLSVLGELERRGFVRPIGDETYDFTHDLVRQTTYRSISQPRRKLLHRNIARALKSAWERDGASSADLAYHAGLAGDDETAARACLTAGEQALRLFANSQAANFAERGLRHVERVTDDPAKLEIHIALLKLRILAAAGPGMRPLPPLVETITRVLKAAESLELHAVVATGHHLLSVLHQDTGDTPRARKSTLRAAEAGRYADRTTRAKQLANTARCLLELETGIDRARELVSESGAIADPFGLQLCELHWARGLLARWNGDSKKAIGLLAEALKHARAEEDRWREYKCLTWLAMIEHELGRYPDMQARCKELGAVAARLGEDETPFVTALQALACLAENDANATDMFDAAAGHLRSVDDKSHLAYALNSAARLHLRAGRTDHAHRCASEALAAASTMNRKDEIAIAQGLLARTESARDATGAIPTTLKLDDLSHRARDAWRGLSKLRVIPTAAPTQRG